MSGPFGGWRGGRGRGGRDCIFFSFSQRFVHLLLAISLLGISSFARGEEAETPPERKRRTTLEDRTFRMAGQEVLSFHKLNFVVVGGDDLKLQYSFKLRLVDNLNLFLAFSNYMLWDIYEESIPLVDNNFNPEAFYRFLDSERWMAAIDTGYVHLSNGEDGPESRAIDRVFVRASKAGRFAGYTYYASVNAYGTVSLGEHNPDYSDYLGWWDFTLWIKNLFRQENSASLDFQYQQTAGHAGNPFQRGNNIIGLQYRFGSMRRLNPTLYVQWFNGYGDSIIFYNESREELRGGFSWYY